MLVPDLTAAQIAALEAAEAEESGTARSSPVTRTVGRSREPNEELSLDADGDLLIGMTMSSPAIYPHISFVRALDFETPFHQSAWSAITRTLQAGGSPTPSELSSLGSGLDVMRLTDLARRAPKNPEAARAAATRVADARRARQAAALFRDAARRIVDGEAGRQNDETTWQAVLHATLDEAVRLTASRDSRHASVVEADARQRIAAGRPRIATGLKRLDDFLDGGLLGGTLTAICAPAKAGKTAMAATLSYNMEARGIQHLFVTLQRHDSDVEDLKLGRLCRVRASRLTREALAASPGFAFKRRCEYMHKPGAGIDEIVAESRHQVWINGAKAIIVDFYQLIGGKLRNERDDSHMGRVAQTLQRLAVETGVPIVVLVQLDEMGYPALNREAMRQACNTYLVLHRDAQDPTAFLETQANNVGEEADIGSMNQKSLRLEYDQGPHFRDANEVAR